MTTKKRATKKRVTKKTTRKTQLKETNTSNKAMAPSVDFDFEEDEGLGQESMTLDDYAIPRLSILQALSPQCTKGQDDYNPDAEPGMLLNTATNDLYDGEEGIYIIPITYRSTYIEWVPREQGGGLVADHGSDYDLEECEQDENGRYYNEEGNSIVLTHEYFSFVVNPETGEYFPIVISMTSSQLKKSRRWNTMINQLQVPRKSGIGTFNPAMFYRSYHFRTVPESNNKGSWFGYSITGSEMVPDLEGGIDIYTAAKSMRESILSGEIKAAAPMEDAGHFDEDDTPM